MSDLSVLIIGGSVTGGGGVGNDPTRAWHTFLGNVTPIVHHKGAIDPSYFLHCTKRFVDHNHFDVVLFDLGANMFGTKSASNLVQLVGRVRCLSHAPSVAIINWPGVIRNNETRVAAWRARTTLLEVPHEQSLYSKDRVHPNAEGHARIAERVRLYLDEAPRNVPSFGANCPAPTSEACFPNAPDLPVVRDAKGEPRNWHLVDDSPMPDKMHKYGWTSSTPGANLTLVIPQDDECGAIVTLAFLASNATGPFRLSCAPGCACTRIRMYHQWRVFPFPVVAGNEEWLGVCKNCSRLRVTRETAFNLLRERREPCRLTVTTLTSRRVRLDGLYVQVPDEEYVAFTRHPGVSTSEQRRFGANALRTDCETLGP